MALSYVARVADVPEAPKVDAKRLPELDWNTLMAFSCGAVLGGGPVS